MNLRSIFRIGAFQAGYLRSVIVLMSWTAAAQVVSVVTMLVLTRLFEPAQFGLFSVYTAFVVLLAIVAAARYEFAIGLPSNPDEGAALFTLCALLCATTSAVLVLSLLFAPPDNWLFEHFPEMGPWWFLVAGGVACVGWYNTISYLALRRGQFKVVGKSKALIAVVTAVGQVIAGKCLGGGAGALIYPFVVGQLAGVTIIALERTGTKSWNASASDLIAVARRYAQFPKFFAPGSFLEGVSVMLPVTVIAATVSVSDAGYYALAERALRMPVTLIGSSILQVFYRQMTDLRGDPAAARLLLIKTWRSLALLAVVPCVLISLYGEWLFGHVFGSSWRPSGQVAEVLVGWIFVQFISYPTSNVLVVQERARSYLLWQVTQLSLVASMLLLAHSIGPGSLQWTVGLLVLGQVLVCSLSMLLQWRATGQRNGPVGEVS